jgi:hypothetical protein
VFVCRGSQAAVACGYSHSAEIPHPKLPGSMYSGSNQLIGERRNHRRFQVTILYNVYSTVRGQNRVYVVNFSVQYISLLIFVLSDFFFIHEPFFGWPLNLV